MKFRLLTGIMLILLSALLLTNFNAPLSASDTNLTGEIPIGALLPMTGGLATFGENHNCTVELAVGEVNEFLQEAGANWTMKLVVEDTQLNPDIALEKVESLNARNITLLAGPLSNGELSNIMTYCNANKILVVSHGSTLPELAIPDDYIFRFCPSDRLGQGPAIGRIMYDDGKRYVIPVTRNDAWGVGLEDAAELKFEGLGGTFLPGIRYSPTATDFSAEAADLADKVSDAIVAYGADEVAVLHISFEEATAFMTACSAYAVLDDVKWYGSDGTACSGTMLTDSDVRNFAMTVGYPCPLFSLIESAKYEKVRQHCIAELGREPDFYSYVVYDIVWVYALSLLEVDVYDSETVKAILPTVTRNYFGASGFIELDENGDRKGGDYNIWAIKEVAPGEYDWKVIGKYATIAWEGEFYSLTTVGNSTISNFQFNASQRMISFNVTGLDDTLGFCRVSIPNSLVQYMWNDNYRVLVDGKPPLTMNKWTVGAYAHLNFTYLHSEHEITMAPSPVGGIYIPVNKLELLAPYIALTILSAVAVVTVGYVKKRKRRT